MTGLRYAWAFLTRLPGGAHPPDSGALARSVPWFPVVGVAVGALTSVVYVPLAEVLPALTAAGLALAFSALVTGAFHEDGFADSLDALAGGVDAADRVRILKDPRHGTFAVVGLLFLTLVKVSALAALTGGVAAAALVAAGCLGRAGAVGLMGWAPAARQDGLGAGFLAAVPRRSVVLALAVGSSVGILALGPVAAPAIILVAGAAAVVRRWAGLRIGGVTGDLLGAAEQLGECAVLVLVAGVGPDAVWFG